jgi:hypothetical protein
MKKERNKSMFYYYYTFDYFRVTEDADPEITPQHALVRAENRYAADRSLFFYYNSDDMFIDETTIKCVNLDDIPSTIIDLNEI